MDETPTLICIDETEFENLKKDQMQLLSIKNINKSNLRDINTEIEEKIKYKIERVEKRQIEQEKYLYELNGEIRRNEIELQNKLKEQNKKLIMIRQEYLELFKKEKQEFLSIFMEQSNTIFKALESFKQINNQSVDKEISELYQQVSKKKDRVLLFINDLKIISKSLENIPHQKFFPGKYEYAKSLLLEVIQDFNADFFESALTGARNCYKVLLELKEDVLKKEQEYIYLEGILSKEIKYLTKLLENNHKELKIDNKIVSINISDFNLENINKSKRWVNNIEKLLENEYNYSIDELKLLIKKAQENTDKLLKDSERIIEQVISSQIRFNTANFLINVFDKLFYLPDSFGYTDSDYRKGYFISLINRLNNKIKIHIEPDKKNPANLKLRMKSDDKNINIELIKKLIKDFNLLKLEGLIDYQKNN